MNFKALYSVEEIKTITKLHYLWTQLIYFYASNSRDTFILINLFLFLDFSEEDWQNMPSRCH